MPSFLPLFSIDFHFHGAGGGERESTWEIFCPLVHSPGVHNNRGWARPKPGALNPSGSCTWLAGTQVLKSSPLVSQHVPQQEAGTRTLDIRMDGGVWCQNAPFTLGLMLLLSSMLSPQAADDSHSLVASPGDVFPGHHLLTLESLCLSSHSSACFSALASTYVWSPLNQVAPYWSRKPGGSDQESAGFWGSSLVCGGLSGCVPVFQRWHQVPPPRT